MFACGIWNSAQGIRNPASDCKPKSSIHRQEIPNPAPESRIQVDLPYTWRENYVISEIKGRGGGGGGGMEREGEQFLPILQRLLDCQQLRQTQVYPVCW